MAVVLNDPAVWRVWEQGDVYRFQQESSPYPVDGSWPTNRGRFDNGVRHTLYLATSAVTAVAEYFRRHPELLEFQGRTRLRTYQMRLEPITEGLDLRTAEQIHVCGFDGSRLRSSERDESQRYKECRELAVVVEAQGGSGIAHQSAAYMDGQTFALFGQQSDGRWKLSAPVEVPTPAVDPAQVRVIES